LNREGRCDVGTCCRKCDGLGAPTSRAAAAPQTGWSLLTVTVDGAVIRRLDAISGEWQYGWRIRDAADAGSAAERPPRRSRA
jgi:hypothetical protein